MDFNLLPLEIKCHIFSFLSFDVLNVKVAIVCKQWQALTRDRRVVKHIQIDERFDSKAIIRHLTTYNLARSLKITNVLKSKWILRIPINNNLRLLEIDHCHFDQAKLPFFSTRYPKISTLKLFKCKYSSRDISIETTARRRLFDYCNSDCLKLFAENCQRLENIDIQNLYDVDDETSVQTLLNKHGSTLKKLRLSGNELTDNNFITLSQCPLIMDLTFFHLLYMTDSQLLSIKKLRSLRKLSMKGMRQVSENAIAELFAESPFPHLHSINLRQCDISDDVLDSLSKSYPNLKSLEIASCSKITTASVLSVICNCRVLESLYMMLKGHITEDTLALIISRLQHQKYLFTVGYLTNFCELQLLRQPEVMFNLA